jgi:hypothetical protein
VWLVLRLAERGPAGCLLRAELTEELAAELLRQLATRRPGGEAELIAQDATRMFCRVATLQRLAEWGLATRVLAPIRLLALTINPWTPVYPCATRELLAALHNALPAGAPPVLDVRAEQD